MNESECFVIDLKRNSQRRLSKCFRMSWKPKQIVHKLQHTVSRSRTRNKDRQDAKNKTKTKTKLENPRLCPPTTGRSGWGNAHHKKGKKTAPLGTDVVQLFLNRPASR